MRQYYFKFFYCQQKCLQFSKGTKNTTFFKLLFYILLTVYLTIYLKSDKINFFFKKSKSTKNTTFLNIVFLATFNNFLHNLLKKYCKK